MTYLKKNFSLEYFNLNIIQAVLAQCFCCSSCVYDIEKRYDSYKQLYYLRTEGKLPSIQEQILGQKSGDIIFKNGSVSDKLICLIMNMSLSPSVFYFEKLQINRSGKM